MDGGPVAPAAAHSLSGPALDAACRSRGGARARRRDRGAGVVGRERARAARDVRARAARRRSRPPPWPARRALDFCAELALALAPLHEAGVAHGAAATRRASASGPTAARSCTPRRELRSRPTTSTASASCCFSLLTGRSAQPGLVVAGEVGPAADAAALLQGLLAVRSGRPPGLGARGRGAARRDRLAPSRTRRRPSGSAAPAAPRAPGHGHRPARRSRARAGALPDRAPRRAGRGRRSRRRTVTVPTATRRHPLMR